MANLIRSTVFLRTSDWTLLKLDSYEKGKQKSFEDDIEIIIKKIQSNNPRQDERNKLQTGNGVWCYKLDDQKLCYLVLTANDYPERQSFAMIKEMERELKKFDNYANSAPKEVNAHIKMFIKDLQDKYNNLAQIDKLVQAQGQIEDVRLIMEKNVQDMLQNQTQVEHLDGKADKMRLDAKQFQAQSTDLARLMYWRNVKLKVGIIIIVLCVILYITIPLIITATAANKANESIKPAETSASTDGTANTKNKPVMNNNTTTGDTTNGVTTTGNTTTGDTTTNVNPNTVQGPPNPV